MPLTASLERRLTVTSPLTAHCLHLRITAEIRILVTSQTFLDNDPSGRRLELLRRPNSSLSVFAGNATKVTRESLPGFRSTSDHMRVRDMENDLRSQLPGLQ
jgi:hypothetical protein